MADRLESLGGSLDPVKALPFGGTTVRGKLPAGATARSREQAADA
jgi:hypothetical protein